MAVTQELLHQLVGVYAVIYVAAAADALRFDDGEDCTHHAGESPTCRGQSKRQLRKAEKLVLLRVTQVLPMLL